MDNNKESIPEGFKYAASLSRAFRAFSGFRMASYASDVGEATRGTLPGIFVNTMYAVTISYIGSDLYFKWRDNKQLRTLPKEENNALTPFQKYMGYHTLWHTQASLLFPTMTIHTIVNLVRESSKKLSWINPKVNRFLPAGIALASIPFLIEPLDKLADITMKYTYCQYLDFKPEERKH
ncbi:mitochondrial 18 KDa protein [Tupanvirus soda lake]|uniref:Mitochondrial 18 kDa protein n=2 Tax=Tupanvirus TaxID=2094720 RepID=A0A6N1P229_9VIRU|nr:mitochondrial 18 KDa protein [Tupanvirus soda lake]QKU35872.1 mitochondrial 18 KDa protein [Tupanvirus soda lake]